MSAITVQLPPENMAALLELAGHRDQAVETLLGQMIRRELSRARYADDVNVALRSQAQCAAPKHARLAASRATPSSCDHIPRRPSTN